MLRGPEQGPNEGRADGLPRNTLGAAVLLLVAGLLYQVLLGVSRGQYSRSLVLASAGLFVIVATAVALAPGGPIRRTSLVGYATVMLIAVQSGLATWMPATFNFRELPAPVAGLVSQQALVVAFVLALGALAARMQAQRLRMVAVVLLAALNLAMSVLVVERTPPPDIDVIMFHHDATAALVDGVNPYAITFPNVYAPRENNSRFYSAEVQKDGRVLFGYPYPPLSLFLVAPGQLLGGDPRYALALCYALAVLVVGLIGRGVVSLSAAAVLSASPACWLLILSAWTEPQLLLGLAVVGYCGVRRPRWLPVALGLFLALKQYALVFLPLLFLLVPRPLNLSTSGRLIARVFAVSVAVSLPLIVWDLPAFWHSAVHIHAIQPFRGDSFSFLAMYAHRYPAARPPSSMLAFPLLVPAWAVLLWRLPRDITGVVIGVGATMMVFLSANQQAFLNYHAFAAGALLVAAAVYEGVYGGVETAR